MQQSQSKYHVVSASSSKTVKPEIAFGIMGQDCKVYKNARSRKNAALSITHTSILPNLVKKTPMEQFANTIAVSNYQQPQHHQKRVLILLFLHLPTVVLKSQLPTTQVQLPVLLLAHSLDYLS